MSGRILLRGGCVLTLDSKLRNLPRADVLIEGPVISEIGTDLTARDAQVIDVSDAIVMPGFVDTHRHVWTSLLRNLGDPGTNGGRPSPAAVYGTRYRPEDVYAATLVGLLGAVEAGITTVVDWSDVQFDDTYTDATLQAHADAGLRTVLVHPAPHSAGSDDDGGAAMRRLVARRHVTAGAATTMAAGTPHLPSSHLDRVARDWEVAREAGLRIHAHAGLEGSGAGAVSGLGQRGLLRDDVTLVHCSNLDDADLDTIAASGAAVSTCPSSEMARGLGAPPIQRLIDRGIRPGLGIDEEMIAPGDMFAQMRATISLQHATVFDLKLAGKAGLPNMMSTREVIRSATVDGARVAGLGDVTGSLQPGKQADVVVLRTDRPNIFPINDPIGAVVWGMDTSNLDWVFTSGRALMRHGVLDADVTRARELAMAARAHVAAAAGPLVETRSAG